MNMPVSAPLVIDGELTVYAVSELRDRLLQALNEHSDLCLDLSAVSEVDGAGVQLLLAARKEATLRGGQLSLLAPSRQVLEAIELIDLHHEWPIHSKDPSSEGTP